MGRRNSSDLPLDRSALDSIGCGALIAWLEACRRAAEARFDIGRMVDGYERLYRRLVGSPPCSGGAAPLACVQKRRNVISVKSI